MKAEKYGMPIAQAEPYAACQVAIAQERKLFAELHFAHVVRELPKLAAAFDQRGLR